METVVVIVCLLGLFAVALPAGFLSFVFPFTFCSENKRATAFDFYNRVIVIWTEHFLGCNSSASYHCFVPHYPKPLCGSLLLHNIEFHRISLVHYMARF
jgi:hypothetical protein